jgi:photosystem I subunit IV
MDNMDKMDNTPKQEEEKEETTPMGDGGKQTTLDPALRKTGQGSNQDTRSGATPEAPGGNKTPGSPNQGTEAR